MSGNSLPLLCSVDSPGGILQALLGNRQQPLTFPLVAALVRLLMGFFSALTILFRTRHNP